MTMLTPALLPAFRTAGWHEGRRVDVASDVPYAHPAHAFLAEFGGLEISATNGSTTLVAFQHLPELDVLAVRWSKALATRLIGVGELHNAHGELYVSESGRLFGNSIIHPAFWFIGSDFVDGMQRLLSDERSRPMLLADEPVVRLYGRDYTRSDPEVRTADSPEVR